MFKINDYKSHFEKYFKLFKIMAPKKFVSYGGYDTGLPNGTASSLESLIFFANLVKDENAIIVNAGAGVSSFVLRKIFKNVICTDDNQEYLDVVKRICLTQKLNTDGFIYNIANIPECDYMFYDYGEFAVRMPNLHFAISKTKKIMYADDGDDRENGAPSYRIMLHEVPSIFKDFTSRDCKEAIDVYGRWGILLKRNNNE